MNSGQKPATRLVCHLANWIYRPCMCCMLIRHYKLDACFVKLPASSYVIHVLCGRCQKITGRGWITLISCRRAGATWLLLLGCVALCGDVAILIHLMVTTAPVAEVPINGSVTAAALHIVSAYIVRWRRLNWRRITVPPYRTAAYHIATYHARECASRWSVINSTEQRRLQRGAEANCCRFVRENLYYHQGGIFLNLYVNIAFTIVCVKHDRLVLLSSQKATNVINSWSFAIFSKCDTATI